MGSPSDSRKSTGATEPEARFMKPCVPHSLDEDTEVENAAPIDVGPPASNSFQELRTSSGDNNSSPPIAQSAPKLKVITATLISLSGFESFIEINSGRTFSIAALTAPIGAPLIEPEVSSIKITGHILRGISTLSSIPI